MSLYRLPFRNLSHRRKKGLDSPRWRRLHQESKPRKVAKYMRKAEKHIRCFEIRFAVFLFVNEMEGVPKCIYSDNVTCACFEDVVQFDDLAAFPGLLHPREDFDHMLFHDGFEAADTGS